MVIGGLVAVGFHLVLLVGESRGECQPPYKIEWPSASPVWTMCWVPPDASAGIDGSGLELRHVFYKGKRVFWRANLPVLNVKYDQGSGFCGPTYRDWLNQPQAFEANNVVQPGYAEPTQPPKTVCDAPGNDVGSFAGVAAERLADRLILTSQTRAGWYRYVNRMVFHLDGLMEPQFGFTAVTHPCVNEPHTHHGYWRFDFDIDGAAHDQIQERRRFLFITWWSTLKTEESRLRRPWASRKWRVHDKTTERRVEVVSGPHDTAGGDAWGGADVWALRYHGNETDDGGATGGAMGDAQHIDPYINGEGIDGSDVVLWYRISLHHQTGPVCKMVGPKLRLLGSW